MKLLLLAGTRPEVIKMAGVAYALQQRPDIQSLFCSTGQHRSMLDDTMADLRLKADVDLGVMEHARGLTDLTAYILQKLDPVIANFSPGWVIVQGDTTTAMAGALAAFYRKVPVAHVEAGLRTYNLYSPWPEEGNRKIVSAIATRHFAPTQVSRANLIAEGIADASIVVTGNSVIDALLHTRAKIMDDARLRDELNARLGWIDPNKRLILVTGHRRENFGEGFRTICEALKTLSHRPDVQIIYPLHLNPAVKGPVHEALGQEANIRLIEPLSYTPFVHLMMRCHLIMTDSGGVQEEAPSLGKPVLVMRDTSERPEAITAGTARLVGTSVATIVQAANAVLDDATIYETMSRASNPYGDGTAGRCIVRSLCDPVLL